MSQYINKFLTSPLLTSSIFITTGAYKTYHDYKSADAKYKERFLIKDTVVLAGAATGMFLCTHSGKYLSKMKPVQRFIEEKAQKLISKMPEYDKFSEKIETPLNYGKEIVKNTIENCALFVSGIIGSLCADWLLNKTGFKQPMQKPQNIEQQNFADKTLEQIAGKDVTEAMSARITDMPQLQMLNAGVIGAKALELSKDLQNDNKLAHATSCLINSSLIPMFLLSLSTICTQKLKPVYQIPIVFTTLVGGTIIFNKIQNHHLDFKTQEKINLTLCRTNFNS